MNKEVLQKSILGKLVGKKIIKVVAGGSNGSIIIFHCGNNEFSLSIKCVWRLEDADRNKVIAGWNESNDVLTGNLTREITALVNDSIEKIEISDFFDIKIYFSSNKILNAFCDVTPDYQPETYEENWVVCDKIADQCYKINRNFEISGSKYR